MDAPQILELLNHCQHLLTLCRRADEARDNFGRHCNPVYDAEKDGYSVGYETPPNDYDSAPPHLLDGLLSTCRDLGAAITDKQLDKIIEGDLHAFSDTYGSTSGSMRATLTEIRRAANGILASIVGDRIVRYYEETYNAIELEKKLHNRRYTFASELQEGLKKFRSDPAVRQALVDYSLALADREHESVEDTTIARYQVVKAMTIRAVRCAELVHHIGWHEYANVSHIDGAIAVAHEVKEFIELGVLEEANTLFKECRIGGKWTANKPMDDNYDLAALRDSIDMHLVLLTANRYAKDMRWAQQLKNTAINAVDKNVLAVETELASTMASKLRDIPKLEDFRKHVDCFNASASREHGMKDHWLSIARSLATLRAPESVELEQVEVQVEVERIDTELGLEASQPISTDPDPEQGSGDPMQQFEAAAAAADPAKYSNSELYARDVWIYRSRLQGSTMKAIEDALKDGAYGDPLYSESGIREALDRISLFLGLGKRPKGRSGRPKTKAS